MIHGRHNLSYVYAEEASRPDPTGLEALHIIFPELPNRPETTTLDLSGLEPIMSNTHVQLFKRRVRCFLFLLVLGMCFYFSVFIGKNKFLSSFFYFSTGIPQTLPLFNI